MKTVRIAISAILLAALVMGEVVADEFEKYGDCSERTIEAADPAPSCSELSAECVFARASAAAAKVRRCDR